MFLWRLLVTTAVAVASAAKGTAAQFHGQQAQGLHINGVPARFHGQHQAGQAADQNHYGFGAASYAVPYGVQSTARDAKEFYMGMPTQLCFTSGSPRDCLQLALDTFEKPGSSLFWHAGEQEQRLAISALEQFVGDLKVMLKPAALKNACIALAGLYQKANDPMGVNRALGRIIGLSKDETRSLITHAFAGATDIQTHIASALKSFDDPNDRLIPKSAIKAAAKADNAQAKLIQAKDLYLKDKVGTAERYEKQALEANPDLAKHSTALKNPKVNYEQFKNIVLGAPINGAAQQSNAPRPK